MDFGGAGIFLAQPVNSDTWWLQQGYTLPLPTPPPQLQDLCLSLQGPLAQIKALHWNGTSDLSIYSLGSINHSLINFRF